MYKKFLGASWKTSVAGWLALIASVCAILTALLDGKPETVPDWEALITAAIGLGLIASRDNKVTSEEAKNGD